MLYRKLRGDILMVNICTKFRKNPFITFGVILILDRHAHISAVVRNIPHSEAITTIWQESNGVIFKPNEGHVLRTCKCRWKIGLLTRTTCQLGFDSISALSYRIFMKYNVCTLSSNQVNAACWGPVNVAGNLHCWQEQHDNMSVRLW